MKARAIRPSGFDSGQKPRRSWLALSPRLRSGSLSKVEGSAAVCAVSKDVATPRPRHGRIMTERAAFVNSAGWQFSGP